MKRLAILFALALTTCVPSEKELRKEIERQSADIQDQIKETIARSCLSPEEMRRLAHQIIEQCNLRLEARELGDQE